MNKPTEGLTGLGLVLLSYMLAIITLATLAPFDFAMPTELGFGMRWSVPDVVYNLLLMLPAGFLYRLSTPRSRGRYCLDVLWLGLGLSAVIETLQMFIPTRYASPIDVVTNGAGAWLGALTHRRLSPWLDRRLSGQFGLRLPLLNLLYLAMPVLWLDGVAATSHERLLLAIPLGAFAAGIAVAVWRHRLADRPGLTQMRVVVSVMLWFGLAILPTLFRAPAVYLLNLFAVTAITRVMAVLSRDAGSERRFELPTLRRVGPLLGLYVLGLSLWPWVDLSDQFRVDAGVFRLFNTRPRLLAQLEAIAAFTMIGYLAAEMRGRRDPAGSPGLATGFVTGLLVALPLELLRGFHPRHGASVASLCFVVSGAVWGAAIYRSQLATVRAMLARPPASGPASDQLA